MALNLSGRASSTWATPPSTDSAILSLPMPFLPASSLSRQGECLVGQERLSTQYLEHFPTEMNGCGLPRKPQSCRGHDGPFIDSHFFGKCSRKAAMTSFTVNGQPVHYRMDPATPLL